MQPGRDDQFGKYPWIIKQQTTQGASGWRYLVKYDSEDEARQEYTRMLESGLYLEG